MCMCDRERKKHQVHNKIHLETESSAYIDSSNNVQTFTSSITITIAHMKKSSSLTRTDLSLMMSLLSTVELLYC